MMTRVRKVILCNLKIAHIYDMGKPGFKEGDYVWAKIQYGSAIFPAKLKSINDTVALVHNLHTDTVQQVDNQHLQTWHSSIKVSHDGTFMHGSKYRSKQFTQCVADIVRAIDNLLE